MDLRSAGPACPTPDERPVGRKSLPPQMLAVGIYVACELLRISRHGAPSPYGLVSFAVCLLPVFIRRTAVDFRREAARFAVLMLGPVAVETATQGIWPAMVDLVGFAAIWFSIFATAAIVHARPNPSGAIDRAAMEPIPVPAYLARLRGVLSRCTGASL